MNIFMNVSKVLNGLWAWWSPWWERDSGNERLDLRWKLSFSWSQKILRKLISKFRFEPSNTPPKTMFYWHSIVIWSAGASHIKFLHSRSCFQSFILGNWMRAVRDWGYTLYSKTEEKRVRSGFVILYYLYTECSVRERERTFNCISCSDLGMN